MKTFLVVLVVVLGATTAWLWLRTPSRQPQIEPTPADVQLPSNGVLEAEEAESGLEFAGSLPHAVLPDQAADAAQSPPSRGRGNAPALERRLMQDKEYADARRRLIGLTMAGRFPDIERVLEITPETAERLFAVLAEQRVQQQGVRGKESSTDPAQVELEKQEREYALKTAITGVIGEAKVPRYEEYRDSLFERYQVAGLQYELMNSEDPLDFDDAQPVIEAMYDERQGIERELTATHGASDTGEDDDYPASFVVDGKKIADLDAKSSDRIFAAAARHLSPTQAQVFRRMLDNGAEMERLWGEIQRMRSDAKAGQSN